MTNLLHTLLLTVAGTAMLHCGNTSGQELEPIGVLPELDANWEVSVDDQQSKTEAKSRFRWVVFRNKRTGDFISFATHPELGKTRGLEYLSDTSLEIFPNGRAIWTQPHSNATKNVVAIEVVDIGRNNASLKGENCR